MAEYRDAIAAHLIKTLPDDVLILWDNITPPARQSDTPFVRVAIQESTNDRVMHLFLQGELRLDIASPVGSGAAFDDEILTLIRQKICFVGFDNLSFLDRQIGKREIIGAYHVTPVTIVFMRFDRKTYG